MKIISVLLLMMLMTSGCDQQIADFVGSGNTPGSPQIEAPGASTSQSGGIKVSPGANLVLGSQLKSRFAITPTRRGVTGTQVKSNFTFHQNRPE